MKFTLKKELPFILKPGVIEGYIESEGALPVLKSGSYKQVLKAGEYKKLLKAAGLVDEAPSHDIDELENEEEEVTQQKKRGRPKKGK